MTHTETFYAFDSVLTSQGITPDEFKRLAWACVACGSVAVCSEADNHDARQAVRGMFGPDTCHSGHTIVMSDDATPHTYVAYPANTNDPASPCHCGKEIVWGRTAPSHFVHTDTGSEICDIPLNSHEM